MYNFKRNRTGSGKSANVVNNLPDNIKQILFIFFTLIVLIVLFKKYIIIFGTIFFCVLVMLHKRYLSVVLGIDVCMIVTLLASAKYGAITGAVIGGLSFLLGMFVSLEVTKSPIMTFYGASFYVILGIIFSIFPASIVYSIPFLIIIGINLLFAFGAFFLGAPLEFLIRYIITNTIANLLFLEIFGGLLKIVF
jgi:hypothetical protein